MKSLLDELPVYTLGCELNNFCKILLYFLLPSFFSLIIYLLLIFYDFTLVGSLITLGYPGWGSTTLLLTFLPSITGAIFILSSIDRWPSKEPFARANIRFLMLNIWHVFGFPFAGIYRFVHQMFWSVEAMCANYVSNLERRENALRILMKPNSVELYFFLQAYLHSAPNIIMQFYIVLTETLSNPDMVNLQIISIVMALFRMAITTMFYQRFERRKVLGVHYPWTAKRMLTPPTRLIYPNQQRETVSEASTLIPSIFGEDEVELRSKHEYRVSNALSEASTIVKDHSLFEGHDDEIFKEPVVIPRLKEQDQDSSTSSETMYEEPVDIPRKTVTINEDVEIRASDDNLRSKIVDMSKHITPPSNHAPRIKSISDIKEIIVNNANTFVDNIPKRRYKDYKNIDLPVRIKRQVIKGVEQEDGVARLVAFVAWLLFITSRMMTIAIFFYFYPVACISVCIVHYLFAISMLIWNSWTENNYYRKFFYLFLGYVYLFCLIEFKVNFKKVRLWYGMFFSIVMIEDFILTVIWFWTGDYSGFWFLYMALFIIGSAIFSFMCFLVYFLILKPKPILAYPEKSYDCLFPAVI